VYGTSKTVTLTCVTLPAALTTSIRWTGSVTGVGDAASPFADPGRLAPLVDRSVASAAPGAVGVPPGNV
jgi:hypothetical protein